MIPMSATSRCAVEDTWFARAVHVSKNGRMEFTTTGRAWHQLRARLEIWEISDLIISDLIIRHEDGVAEIPGRVNLTSIRLSYEDSFFQITET